MFEDGDAILTAVGVVLVVVLLAGLALVANGIVNPSSVSRGDQPATNWTLERVNDTHVQITHAGGEPVRASELLVAVGGNRRHVGATGRLAEGDSFVVPASGSGLVELYWTGGRGGPELIASWRVA